MTEATDERRRVRGRRLTDRQAAIMELVAAGLENKEIGRRLGISEQAVKEHVSNLLRLLSAPNRAALADVAATMRLIGSAEVPREWLGLLFVRAPILIALLEGPEHRFVAVNDAYRRTSGGHAQVGLTFREAFPDFNVAGVVRLLDEAYATGEPRSASEFAARFRDAPGVRYGYITTLIEPLRRPDGTVGGLAFFGIDVSTEVQARMAARELSDERTAILEQLPSGVVTVQPDGRIATVNETGRRILGIGDEAVGLSAWDVFTLTDRDSGGELPLEERPLRRALRGERVPPTEYRGLVVATGQHVDLRISAAPLFGAKGEVRGAVAVFTPVVFPLP
jgi:PAS domain S-box-containing protein